MFKAIEKITNFGVFPKFSKVADTNDFVEKNIIYGWNYSGKTTISRVFSCMQRKNIHKDYPKADFTVTDTDNKSWKPNNIETCPLTVRVFNTDFIEKNLNWKGESFNPILLLGTESIEAQDKIELNNKKIEKCQLGIGRKQSIITKNDEQLRSNKTNKAKQIKKEVGITAAFDSRHLDNYLSIVKKDPTAHVISDKRTFATLKTKALSSDTDKLPIISSISINVVLGSHEENIKKLLSKVPEFSETIDYLKNNPAVANWVENGLPIHQERETCEFCGNELSEERINALTAHFSEDLKNHKLQLRTLRDQISNLKVDFPKLHERDFYPDFRKEFNSLKEQLEKAVKIYNREIKKAEKSLTKKHDSPFEPIDKFTIDTNSQKEIEDLIKKLAKTIKKNDQATNEFEQNRLKAIEKLKKHYAAELYQEVDIEKNDRVETLLNRHIVKYQNIRSSLEKNNKDLEAAISKAQKGREEINKFITRFLGRDEISIEVTSEIAGERFRLTRNKKVAKNLSEGEKTAISFSFFLTKLLELPSLEEAVVYIDDPVSSLDSNHVFQINSILKKFFFYQDGGVGTEWKLKCKQLFVSTHNFEFFSLLKELPLNKNKSRYYLVKRIGVTEATFCNLPSSIENYSSEYHYLFNVIHKFHLLDDKSDLEILLSIPNALRRFLEIYTYAKIPTFSKATVDQRADRIFGSEESKRILKVLHYFSHLNNIDRLVNHSDLISDIENVVNDVIEHLKKDKMHYEALLESVQ